MVERLSGILGQERAVALLRRYLSAGAAPHGLLFAGEWLLRRRVRSARSAPGGEA